MTKEEALFIYCLRLGDNALILSHRLGELCSKGPYLEEDIALTNIALDQIGCANNWYEYAVEVEGKGRTPDDLAYKRGEREFYNKLITEQPNGDFGKTIARQFFIDVFEHLLYSKLALSKDEKVAAIATKSLKEVKYHLMHSSNWMLRLGDGTEESNKRVQKGVNDLWMFTGELFEMDTVDELLIKEEIVPDLNELKTEWDKKIKEIFSQALLEVPKEEWMQTGSMQGKHSENLGYILAEMQYLPRAYPDAQW